MKLRLPALPVSPPENSAVGRASVFAGFCVALVGVVLYGQDYVVTTIGFVVAGLGHVVSYRERNRPRGRNRQILLAGLVFAALAYFLLDSIGAIFGGVLPQANFAIMLVAITSFDLKTRRNCYSSLWISLVVLYLAAVYAWDYQFGILIALWAVCLAGFWTASHLRRIDARFALPRTPVAVMLGGAFLLGIAAFVLIPQPSVEPPGPVLVSLPNYVSFKGELESPALPLVQLSSDPSGATNSVDLRYRGRLGEAPVMYVRTGAPAYWRGLVFDEYTNGQWTASRRGYQLVRPYVEPRELPPQPPNNLGTFVQVFRVLRPLPGVINAAYPLQSAYAPVSEMRLDSYGTLHVPGQLRPGETYSVVSYLPNLTADVLRTANTSSDPPEGNPAYLDYGALSARARAQARDATNNVRSLSDATRFDLVMALTSFLQTHYTYSQQVGHVQPGVDPIDQFLFYDLYGYCEQFATAETLMLRSLGIPARLATGYSTGTYDSVLDQSVVRERDAHAWVEVWFGQYGWVPVDPSPGFSPLAATRFPDHWAAGGLARLIPHLTVGAPAAVLSSLGVIAVIPGAIAIAFVVVLAYAWLRRRMRRRAGASPGESGLLRLYDRMQRRIGRRRAPPETPLEYLHRVQSDALLDEVTSAVNSGAYAGRWPAPTQIEEWTARLR